MVVHALFPIIVCQFNYPNHKEFKELFFNNSMKHLNSSGYSDEMTGHVTIHHEEVYADMYKFLVSSVRNYLDVLNVQHSLFEINVIKSWLNILENRNTPMHAHKDAHISTSYYANTPKETNQPIRFPSLVKIICASSICWYSMQLFMSKVSIRQNGATRIVMKCESMK